MVFNFVMVSFLPFISFFLIETFSNVSLIIFCRSRRVSIRGVGNLKPVRLRFYCFLSLGRDYASTLMFFTLCDVITFDSIVFYLWDVIMLRFYCFLSLGRDYASTLMFFTLWDVITL